MARNVWAKLSTMSLGLTSTPVVWCYPFVGNGDAMALAQRCALGSKNPSGSGLLANHMSVSYFRLCCDTYLWVASQPEMWKQLKWQPFTEMKSGINDALTKWVCRRRLPCRWRAHHRIEPPANLAQPTTKKNYLHLLG